MLNMKRCVLLCITSTAVRDWKWKSASWQRERKWEWKVPEDFTCLMSQLCSTFWLKLEIHKGAQSKGPRRHICMLLNEITHWARNQKKKDVSKMCAYIFVWAHYCLLGQSGLIKSWKQITSANHSMKAHMWIWTLAWIFNTLLLSSQNEKKVTAWSYEQSEIINVMNSNDIQEWKQLGVRQNAWPL